MLMGLLPDTNRSHVILPFKEIPSKQPLLLCLYSLNRILAAGFARTDRFTRGGDMGGQSLAGQEAILWCQTKLRIAFLRYTSEFVFF